MKSFVLFSKFLSVVLLCLLFEGVQAAPSDILPVSISGQAMKLAQVLTQIERQTDVTFSYESSQVEKLPLRNVDIHQVSLTECMDRLCRLWPIAYQYEGHLVIVKVLKSARVTLSGFVRDSISGEALSGAVVYDHVSHTGTSTNEHGFFSLSLKRGDKAQVEVSYVGYGKQVYPLPILLKDFALSVSLHGNSELEEVVVNAANDPHDQLHIPQMGETRFNYEEIKRMPTLFGEADIVKTIQAQPGVSPGTAGFANMYVRGGNGDDNLYLLEGNPLYEVNHAAGLFSAFNAEAVKHVDFYKSAFPARYGERLSSVVDVQTKDGNLREYHGSAMLGLTSGSLNLEGPLVKEKTSFNFNLRRTWYDILTVPAIAIWNATRKDASKLIARYAFTDLNIKLTHHFNDRSRAFAGIYFGRDYLKGGSKQQQEGDEEKDVSRLKWGSVMGFAGWSYAFSPKLYGTMNAAYTRYASNVRRDREESTSGDITTYNSTSTNGIDDISLRTDFDWQPSPRHDVRFGGRYVYHRFRPSYNSTHSSEGTLGGQANAREQLFGHETALYAEDDYRLCSVIRLNAGLRFSLYNADGKTYTNVEPRLSTVFRVAPQWSLKASYARMNQYVHQVSDSYISLPTDMWVPVTAAFKPLRSDQVSAGVYYTTSDKAYSFSVEGYYKWLHNLLDYRDGYNFLPSFVGWDRKFTAGRGDSYGMELFARKEAGKLTGYIGYALSWNNRQFDEIDGGKPFPAKFDNRHKLNIVANWRVSHKVELNASWTYMTGNRITVAFENYLPLGGTYTGDTPPKPPMLMPQYIEGTGFGYYTSRNNYRLPAYHRLDLGVNIYRHLRKGRTGIWNISLYNAYCYMAPVAIHRRLWYYVPYTGMNGYADHKQVDAYFEMLRLIPIIPSVSYTYKF